MGLHYMQLMSDFTDTGSLVIKLADNFVAFNCFAPEDISYLQQMKLFAELLC